MTGRAAYAVVAALTLVLQLALQSVFFPWSSLSGDQRIDHIDAPFHLYQMEVAGELCREAQVVGYDPFFAAGHLGGVVLNASAKLPALLHCLTGGHVSAEAVYKAVSFWSGVLGPVSLVLACAILGLGVREAAIAGVLAVMAWWIGPLRWYHTAGMVSFVAVAFAMPAFLAAFMRLTASPTPLRILALGLAAALLFLVHPLFAVGSVLLGLPWLVVDSAWPRTGMRRLAAGAAVAVVMVAANWTWLHASLTAPSFANSASPYQRAVEPLLMFKEMLGVAPTAAGGAYGFAGLFVAAVLGLVLAPPGRRRALVAIAAGAATLMAWASFGGLSERIALLQPNRFSAAFWVALILPAAAGLAGVLTRCGAATGRRRVAAVVALLACALPLSHGVTDAAVEALSAAGHPRYGPQPPEVGGSGPIEDGLVDFLRSRDTADQRVFFETSLGRIHDGGHIAGMLAWRSGRELIGGPYPFLGTANAWDGVAFGAELASMGADELAGWLDLYDVGWMLCHTDACKRAMAAVPGTTAVQSWGRVTAYARSSPGRVVEGAAHLDGRCINRVEFSGVAGPRLVLRYHWVPGLRALPSGTVEPVVLKPGAPPFVAVVDPPPAFALRWGDGPGIPCDERPAHAP